MDKTVQATEQANNASTIQVTVRSSISGETMLGRPVVMVSTAQVANLRRCGEGCLLLIALSARAVA